MIDEFQRFYLELFKMAEFGKFNEEMFTISGLTFRRLVKAAVEIVVENYYSLEESCSPSWNYHSAFFFAGTVATTIGYGRLGLRNFSAFDIR